MAFRVLLLQPASCGRAAASSGADLPRRSALAAWLRITLCALALLGLSLPQRASAQEVVYVSDAPRFAEYIELLRTAMERTVSSHGPYTLRPARIDMSETRYLMEARSGELVNVVWSAASREKETQLLPIRIPLGKGLLGYRIAFTAQSQRDAFEQVRTIEDLRHYRFCLGIGWGDVAIYKAAGLPLTLSSYEALFRMTERRHCDLYSRGINEVFDEYERMLPLHPGLAIEPSLLLHYTYPYYFFVSPRHPELAARLEAGLRVMLSDGSFDNIFWKHNATAIQRAGMAQRRVIELPNPDLTPATPLDEARLWYRPGDLPPVPIRR